MKRLIFLVGLLFPLISNPLDAQPPHVAWTRANVIASSLTTSGDEKVLLLFDPSIIEVWNVAVPGNPHLLFSATPHTWVFNLFPYADMTAAGISTDGTIVAYTTDADEEVVTNLPNHTTIFDSHGGSWNGDATLNWTGSRTSQSQKPSNPPDSFYIDSSRQVRELNIASGISTRFGVEPIAPSLLAISPDNQTIAAAMGNKIYLLTRKDGSFQDSVIADSTILALAFNATCSQVGYFTSSSLSITDLSTHITKRRSHEINYSQPWIVFDNSTNNLYAAQDSILWYYQTEIDTGVWRRSVLRGLRAATFSSDGNKVVFAGSRDTALCFLTSNLVCLDTIADGWEPTGSTHPITFASNSDTLFFATGYYDAVEDFNEGSEIGYALNADTAFWQSRGYADALVATRRLVIWQLSTPYEDILGVYDRFQDSVWNLSATAPIAAGSDTLRCFVTGGLDGITMWTWDSTLSDVKAKPPENSSNLTIIPNPCAGKGEMIWSSPSAEHVQITMLDALGRNVGTPFDGEIGLGEQHIPFDVSKLRSGIYFGIARSSNQFEVARFSVMH